MVLKLGQGEEGKDPAENCFQCSEATQFLSKRISLGAARPCTPTKDLVYEITQFILTLNGWISAIWLTRHRNGVNHESIIPTSISRGCGSISPTVQES